MIACTKDLSEGLALNRQNVFIDIISLWAPCPQTEMAATSKNRQYDYTQAGSQRILRLKSPQDLLCNYVAYRQRAARYMFSVPLP